MDVIKNYILSLAGFSFISSIVCSLIPEISTKKTVKFICGVVLALIILSPLKCCDTDFEDIFPGYESYNLYSNNYIEQQSLTQKLIADKVSQTVEEIYYSYGISGACAEVEFDGDLNISSVIINSRCDEAAREVAKKLGLSYEIIHISE